MRTISRPLAARTRRPSGTMAQARSRPPRPRSIRMRLAFGESWIPAPGSSSRAACSRTVTRKPRRASANAAVSPAMPAPATMTVRDGVRTSSPRGGSNGGVGQRALGRPRRARRESRIVAVKGGTVGADIFGIVAHVAEDMRMIEGRLGADAHEFLGADFDHRNAGFVMEVRDNRFRHGP